MDARHAERCIAFKGDEKLAEGRPEEVALAMRAALDAHATTPLRAFDEATGRALEFDLRGSQGDVRARFGGAEPKKPGRPKLGVAAREVTLLPRHWDWLAAQPGGASATLRRLVERARSKGEGVDQARAAQEATYRFMSEALGDHAGFEEASRALFACDGERFAEIAGRWPADLADYARRLAAPAFTPAAEPLRAARG